jgi:hypothetical protein
MKTKTSLTGISMNRARVRLPFLTSRSSASAWFALPREPSAKKPFSRPKHRLGRRCAFQKYSRRQQPGIGFNALNQTPPARQHGHRFFCAASNTTGNGNIATGSGALGNNTTGAANSAIGAAALLETRLQQHCLGGWSR